MPDVSELLKSLVDEQLSSVTFVQDYLQLDFDGKRLTLNVWPRAESPSGIRTFSDAGYRDALCSLIACSVVSVAESESEIRITFAEGALAVDLDGESSSESVIFDDTVTNAWSSW